MDAIEIAGILPAALNSKPNPLTEVPRCPCGDRIDKRAFASLLLPGEEFCTTICLSEGLVLAGHDPLGIEEMNELDQK